MITYDLSGKTAVVTGASRGIGKAMAEALEEAGAKVVRVSSRDCDMSDRRSVRVSLFAGFGLHQRHRSAGGRRLAREIIRPAFA